MKWTNCIFVRSRSSRQIVHHEIEELDNEQFLDPINSKTQNERIKYLVSKYPSEQFEVFAQGFDSIASLHRAWPELARVPGA